jgi:uncharacterized protein (TIGR02246 family)
MSHAITPICATDAEATVKAVLAALSECWNRHDMAAFSSHFTQNADFVNVFGLHLRGRPAIEAQHIAIHQTFFRNSRLRTLGQSVRFLAPQVAVAHVEWEMTGYETGPMKQWQSEVRKGMLTAVLVSEGDAWRITALHNTDTIPAPGIGE